MDICDPQSCTEDLNQIFQKFFLTFRMVYYGITLLFSYRCGGEGGGHRHIPGVMYLQGLMVVCTVYLVHSTAFSISRKEGLPFQNQLAAWTLLGRSNSSHCLRNCNFSLRYSVLLIAVWMNRLLHTVLESHHSYTLLIVQLAIHPRFSHEI